MGMRTSSVAVLAHLFVQALAFAAQHEGGGRGVLDLVVVVRCRARPGRRSRSRALFRSSSVRLMLVTRTIGQVLQRARRGLGHHVGDARRAPLRNDHGARSGGVRGADDRAQVVRILHAIQHHHQVARTRRSSRSAYFFAAPRATTPWCAERAGQPVERRARLEAHRHRRPPRQIDDLLQSRAARALRHQDALQRRAAPAAPRPPDEFRSERHSKLIAEARSRGESAEGKIPRPGFLRVFLRASASPR